MSEIIQQEFSHIEVYGKKFTAHHKNEIEDAVRKIIEKYTNWLHYRGYKQVEHKDWQPRVWRKGGKFYKESDLYFKFLHDNNYHR